MVNDLVIQADEEFKQGNFTESSRLYAEALEGSEPSDNDLAHVLQKLGDSDYAQNNYKQAQQSYERLVELHDSGNFDSKDRVNVLLKLAKCNEKIEDNEGAKGRFNQAYDLAKSTLSEKHYLRRTVLDSFAEYLRNAGDDFDLLHSIEDELGIEHTPAVKEEKPIDEVTPESVAVPALKAAPTEREFFVLKTKLDKFKRSSLPAADDEKKKKIEAQKQTLDQQVAERKFLRKGSDGDDAGSKNKSRAKLRGALSDPQRSTKPPEGEAARVEPATPAKDFTKSGEYAYLDEDKYSAGTPRTAEKSDSQRAFEAALNPGFGSEQPSLAKYAGMMPRRHFSDRLEEVSRTKKGVDLVVPSQGTAMAEQSRSFFQHAEAVKKADPAAEVSRDFDQLRTEELAVIPQRNIFKTGLKIGGPAIALVLLAFASVYLVVNSGRPAATTTVPYYLSPLVGHKFVTGDSALTIDVDKNSVTVLNDGKSKTCKLRLWNGSWLDEISLMTGGYKNCRWLYIVPSGLRDDEGMAFYSESAPERKVIAFMDTVATEASEFYGVKGDYPNYSTDIDVNSYSNPFTNKAEGVIIFQNVSEKIDAFKDTSFDAALKNGGTFNNETALGPGAVHALSVMGHPLTGGDTGTYNWAVHCFYIHGCDGEGKLLPSSVPGSVFLLTLKNGRKIEPMPNPEYASKDFCLTQSTPPDTNMIMYKWIGCLIVLLIAIFFAMRSTRVVGRYR
ncbi:MAG TPA: hypothetical protein V6C81_03705 [Planktothrix sp.]|jgi:hypothetical protein